jgi:transposase
LTRLLERLAIDLMLECSIKAACEILRISWDEADGIKQRAVQRGLKRRQAVPLPRLCMDEKSAGRGHDYVTVVARVEPGEAATVWHVGDGRSGDSLDGFWQGLTPEQRASMKAVAMDLGEPYFTSTVHHLDKAEEKIVHDPFHRVRHMNDAVDQVRRQEHKKMLRQNDRRLAGTKYLWLRGEENIKQETQEQFRDLRVQTLKTRRAWAIKEMFRDFGKSPDLEEGKEFFQSWYGWAIRSRLQPVKKVARRFKRPLKNMLTFFIHRLTNGPLEGLNNRIKGLVKKAYGYRSRKRFKIDILFHLGGLNLYPSQ